jgi:hypothetical protein
MEGLDMDIKERIRRAQPTTRSERIWLGADLDLLDEYEAAVQALDEAKKPSDSLAGNGSVADAEQRVEELQAKLDEFAVDFKLRGLDDLHWSRLLDQHQPRKDAAGTADPQDAEFGYNMETFPAALVRAATVEPVMDDDDWRALLGDEDTLGLITSNQLQQLFKVAFRLTRHPVDVPFSPAASKPTRNSGRG